MALITKFTIRVTWLNNKIRCAKDSPFLDHYPSEVAIEHAMDYYTNQGYEVVSAQIEKIYIKQE